MLFHFISFRAIPCRWKEVRHDNTVTWLAYWMDPINQRDFKYVFLAASSRLKGLSNKEKYEKARKLKVRAGGSRGPVTPVVVARPSTWSSS